MCSVRAPDRANTALSNILVLNTQGHTTGNSLLVRIRVEVLYLKSEFPQKCSGCWLLEESSSSDPCTSGSSLNACVAFWISHYVFYRLRDIHSESKISVQSISVIFSTKCCPLMSSFQLKGIILELCLCSLMK